MDTGEINNEFRNAANSYLFRGEKKREVDQSVSEFFN